MIPLIENRTFVQSQPFQSFDFGIDVDDPKSMQMLMKILRDSLYSDKILAVIREYSINAYDANVENGKGNKPIKITLPNQLSPEFRVRDYGKGLSIDDVKNIYTKFGKSTKRNSNEYVGQLGVGCKSGFAYGENFLVISRNNGCKTVYNCIVNGSASVMLSVPMTSDDEDGIEIVIPVASKDITLFQNKALHFFKYWNIVPEIEGIDVSQTDNTITKFKTIKTILYDRDWKIKPHIGYDNKCGIAVMGNIPYHIDWNIVRENLDPNLKSNKNNIIFDFVIHNEIILWFEVGEIEFVANREGLQYTQNTCNAINNKLQKIFDSILNIIFDKIKTAPNLWEAKRVCNQIFSYYHNSDTPITDEGGIFFEYNLYKLKPYCKQLLNWNNINLFEHCSGNETASWNIIQWDSINGFNETGYYNDDWIPVLKTYTESSVTESGIKIERPTHSKNHFIIPSSKSIILINDNPTNYLTNSTCRFLLLEKFKDINKIYLLTFKDSVKQDFYRKQNFESVPVLYISDFINEAKTWINSKKQIINSEVGKKQLVRYIIPNNTNTANYYKYNVHYVWDKERIDLKKLSYPSYYIEVNDDKPLDSNSGFINSPLTITSKHFFTIFNILSINVDKIYGLTSKTLDSVWFLKEKQKGTWINIFDEIKTKLINSKNLDIISHAINYLELIKNHCFIGFEFTKKISPLIKYKNGTMNQLCSLINGDYLKYTDLIICLNYFNLSQYLKEINTDSFYKLMVECRNKYPMIDKYALSVRNNNISQNTISDSDIKILSNYINLVDSFELTNLPS